MSEPMPPRELTPSELTPSELAEELYRRVGAELLRQMRGRPSAEMLQCARAFVAAVGIGPQTEADTKALRRLQTLYLRHLLRALKDPDSRPPASLLAEVGHAIRSAGIKAPDRGPETAIAVDLAALALPFPTQ